MAYKMTRLKFRSLNTHLLCVFVAASIFCPTISQAATIWAKPSKSKSFEVLCIGPEIGLNDFAYLANQFPMKLTSVGIKNRLEPDPLDEKEDSLKSVLERSGSKDLVILANVHPERVSAEAIQVLFNLVESGTSVMWIRYDSELPRQLETVFTESNEESIDINAELSRGLIRNWGILGANQRVRLTASGKGRFLDVLLNTSAPMFHNLLPDIAGRSIARDAQYDNVWSFYVRAIRWMLGAEPKVHIHSLVDLTPKGPDPIDTPPQITKEFVQATIDSALQAPVRTFDVFFSEPLPKKYELEVKIRYPYRNVNWRYNWVEPLKKGTNSVPVLIPVSLGTCWVDVFLKDGDHIVDWYTHDSFVRGWPEIDNVEFPRFIVQPNDTYEVKFRVRKRLESKQIAQAMGNNFVHALLRATDSYGRVIGETQQKLDLDDETQSVVLSWNDALGELIQLDLFLDEAMQGKIARWHEEQGAYVHADLLIQQPDTTLPFYLAMDGVTVNERNNMEQLKVLSQNQLSYLVVDTEMPFGHGAILHDLNQIPRAHLFQFDPAISIDRWMMAQQALDVREEVLSRVLSLMQEQKLYRQSILYLDDVQILNAIQKADSISDEELGYQFVQWLQTQYTDLPQVARRWGIKMEYWSDVHSATENPIRRSRLIQDIRSFMLVHYAGMLEEFLRIFRDELEDARVVIAANTAKILNNAGADISYLETFSNVNSDTHDGSHIIINHEDKAQFTEPSLNLWHFFLKGARGVWYRADISSGTSSVNMAYSNSEGELEDTIQEFLGTYAAMNEQIFPLLEEFEPVFMGKGLPGIYSKNRRTGTRYDFEHHGRTISAWLPELGNPYQQKNVLVEAPEEMFVYDMASGEVVEPGKKKNFSSSSKAPLWVSSLPYSISRILVESPAAVTGGTRVLLEVSVRTTEKLPGDHWIHLQVRGPERELFKHYSQTIFCPGGKGKTILPIAMNEFPGRYQLEFRDLLTGVKVDATLEVIGAGIL
jgi:hypothetical protein